MKTQVNSSLYKAHVQNSKTEFLNSIELFSDDEEEIDHSNDLKYQLRKKLREIKKRKLRDKYKLKIEKKVTHCSTDGKHTVIDIIEHENENRSNVKCLTIEKSIKNIKKKHVKTIDQSVLLENFVKNNLYIPQTREFNESEKKLLVSWKIYSEKVNKVQELKKIKLLISKFLIAFGTIAVLLLLTIIGSAYLIFNFMRVSQVIANQHNQDFLIPKIE